MKKSPFIITFSGDPVSGKSSAITELIKEYEKNGFTNADSKDGNCIVRLAAGQLFRDIANNSGIELQQLNEFAKQPGNSMRRLKEIAKDESFFSNLSEGILDKSVDSFVDEYMLSHISMLKNNYLEKDNVIIIVDSRIAGLLMKKLNKETMNIRFAIQPEIAAERLIKDVQNRKGEIILSKNPKEAYIQTLESVKTRRDKERERFIRTYSSDLHNQRENAKVDIQNLDNYDLVINTSGTSIDREVKVLYDCIEKAREGKTYDKFWRSTKFILPGSLKENISTSDIKSPPRISAIKVDGQYYALYGQEYVGIANHMGYTIEQENGTENGYPLVPVDLIAQKDEFIFDEKGKGIPANLYVKDITEKVISDFEKKYDFNYPNKGIKRHKRVKKHDKNIER